MRHRSVQRVVTNGVGIAYQQLGLGPPLILIHGLATNRAFWYAPIARHLAHRFQVTMYDLRGHGFSDVTTSGYRPLDMVADLRGLMDGLGIERAHIVGHSYGGAVGLSFTAANPERVVSLCVADSRINSLQPVQNVSRVIDVTPLEKAVIERAGIHPEEEAHLGIRLLEELGGTDVVELAAPATGGRAAQPFVPFTGIGRGERVLAQWKKLIATTSASADFRAPFHLTAPDLARVERPTLLVYGGLSRCLQTGERLQQLLPASRLVVVPDVGHFHPVMRPRIFLNNLLRFFRAQRLTVLMRHARSRRAARTVEI